MEREKANSSLRSYPPNLGVPAAEILRWRYLVKRYVLALAAGGMLLADSCAPEKLRAQSQQCGEADQDVAWLACLQLRKECRADNHEGKDQ